MKNKVKNIYNPQCLCYPLPCDKNHKKQADRVWRKAVKLLKNFDTLSDISTFTKEEVSIFLLIEHSKGYREGSKVQSALDLRLFQAHHKHCKMKNYKSIKKKLHE